MVLHKYLRILTRSLLVNHIPTLFKWKHLPRKWLGNIFCLLVQKKKMTIANKYMSS